MHYNFKEMKKGSYFGHVNDYTDVVYKKTRTYKFEDVITGEEFNINDVWPDCYDGDFGMFCLADVEISIKYTWKPEW